MLLKFTAVSPLAINCTGLGQLFAQELEIDFKNFTQKMVIFPPVHLKNTQTLASLQLEVLGQNLRRLPSNAH